MSGWTFHAELSHSRFDWQQIGINMPVHQRSAFSCLGLGTNLDMDLNMNLDICTPLQRPDLYICIRATSVCACLCFLIVLMRFCFLVAIPTETSCLNYMCASRFLSRHLF